MVNPGRNFWMYLGRISRRNLWRHFWKSFGRISLRNSGRNSLRNSWKNTERNSTSKNPVRNSLRNPRKIIFFLLDKPLIPDESPGMEFLEEFFKDFLKETSMKRFSMHSLYVYSHVNFPDKFLNKFFPKIFSEKILEDLWFRS